MSTPATLHPAPAAPARNWFSAGGWYLVLTLLTLGLCAWIPFAHAASRLRSPALWRRAALYAVLDVVLFVLLSITPTDAQGNVPQTGGATAISLVGTFLLLTVVITAIVAQLRLRRQVYYGQPETVGPAQQANAQPGTDPAVAGVLAARARRAGARELAARDPLMARELHIGRPDLRRSYDDGGLVDLNSAPAQVIARVCDMDTTSAQAIVAHRERMGGYSNVDEVFVMSTVPVGAWERIRDRAIVLPR